MKTSQTKIITFNLVLAALLAVAAGCVSKSYDKGAATAAALQSSADAVTQTSTKVNDVLAALNNLTFKSQGDLRDQYDAFVSSAKNLNEANDNLDNKVIQVRNAAASYFESWTNQINAIQSPELKQRSTDRMNEVTAKLKDVDASYEDVKNSFKPFTSDVKDIQTYLGTDLTAGGLNTIKDIVSKTKVDAVPLRDSIKQLQASFSSLSTALSPVLPSAEQK
jgi:predicted  nucleic acid-binding Zn-ribbon protein